jgi:hypothetical protein
MPQRTNSALPFSRGARRACRVCGPIRAGAGNNRIDPIFIALSNHCNTDFLPWSMPDATRAAGYSIGEGRRC